MPVERNNRADWQPNDIGCLSNQDDLGRYEAALFMLNYDPSKVTNDWYKEYLWKLEGMDVAEDYDIDERSLEEIVFYTGVDGALREFLRFYSDFNIRNRWKIKELREWASQWNWALPNGFPDGDYCNTLSDVKNIEEFLANLTNDKYANMIGNCVDVPNLSHLDFTQVVKGLKEHHSECQSLDRWLSNRFRHGLWADYNVLNFICIIRQLSVKGVESRSTAIGENSQRPSGQARKYLAEYESIWRDGSPA